MKRRQFLKTAAASATLVAAPVFAQSTGTHVVLGLDNSGSMFNRFVEIEGKRYKHWDVQLMGHIEALMSDEVSGLLMRNHVLISAFVWAGHLQSARQIARPLLIAEKADVAHFCSELKNCPEKPSDHPSTNHVVPMEYALRGLPRAARNILDLSTDEPVYGEFESVCVSQRLFMERRGWTVNAIAVDDAKERISMSMRQLVVTRDGFVETSLGWEGYARAIRKKLMRELIS